MHEYSGLRILTEWHCVFQNHSLGFLQSLRSFKNWLLQKLWKIWTKNFNSSLKNGYFGAAVVSRLFYQLNIYFSKKLLIKKSGNHFRQFRGWSVIDGPHSKNNLDELDWLTPQDVYYLVSKLAYLLERSRNPLWFYIQFSRFCKYDTWRPRRKNWVRTKHYFLELFAWNIYIGHRYIFIKYKFLRFFLGEKNIFMCNWIYSIQPLDFSPILSKKRKYCDLTFL